MKKKKKLIKILFIFYILYFIRVIFFLPITIVVENDYNSFLIKSNNWLGTRITNIEENIVINYDDVLYIGFNERFIVTIFLYDFVCIFGESPPVNEFLFNIWDFELAQQLYLLENFSFSDFLKEHEINLIRIDEIVKENSHYLRYLGFKWQYRKRFEYYNQEFLFKID